MTRTLAIVAMLIGITASPAHAAGGASTEKVDALGPVQIGMPLPSFAGWDLNGNQVRWKHFIADAAEPHQGAIISVFASWCGPCKVGLKSIDTVVKRNPGVRLLLVNLKEDQPTAARFLAQLGIEAPTILDQYGKVSERMGVNRELPRTFLVDADGRVQQIYTVEGSDFEAVLEQDIRALAASPGR